MTGRLILVATPIGHLGDLSPRALETLAGADVVACEDTRRTGLLLSRQGVGHKRMIVINEHTEVDRIPQVLALLGDGATVAVVSDAGSPGISDPGERLVGAAIEAGFVVGAVPGPSAAITAITISGLPTGRFVFEGFLPRSGASRSERLAELSGERRTSVLYEAPHRLTRTIGELADVCGPDRRIVIARELTKLHEEVWRGSLADAVTFVAEREPLGEYVLVLAGAAATAPADDDAIRRAIGSRLAAGDTTKSAVANVAGALGIARRRVYDLALTMRAEASARPGDDR